MQNLAMQDKLTKGECIDIRGISSLYNGDNSFLSGTFELFYSMLPKNVEFCDAETEQWVLSIGKQHATGRMFAALDHRFYDAGGYTCIWLR